MKDKQPLVSGKFHPSFADECIRWLYSIAITCLVPLVWLHLAFKERQIQAGAIRCAFDRLGRVARPPAKGGWLFHCVSVGEVNCASTVIKALQKTDPKLTITVTTTTATGSARVREIFGDKVHHVFLPFDIPISMALFVRILAPAKVVITEVELWPNFIHAAWRKQIPVTVINARMSTRSAARYGKVGRLFQPILQKISHVCAQGKRDYEAYLSLGCNPDKLHLTQNIKFDQVGSHSQPVSDALRTLLPKDRIVIVGGSTHGGEERALLDAFKSLLHTQDNLMLVIVPRHPQRFEDVASLIKTENWLFKRTSYKPDSAEDCQVLLVDEMGKLNQVYQCADIAFVGGSLADKGGHNALEPANESVPVLMGPHTYNNPEICQALIESGALTIVKNASELETQLNTLVRSPELRAQRGSAGKRVVEENQGALERTLAVLRT